MDKSAKIVHKWGFDSGRLIEIIRITGDGKFVYGAEYSGNTKYQHRCDFDPEFDCQYVCIISAAKAIAGVTGANIEIQSSELTDEEMKECLEKDKWPQT